MTSFRLHFLCVACIVLSANQLGAQNDTAYKTGKRKLSNKADYCRYIQKSIDEQKFQPKLEESFMTNSESFDSATRLEKILFVKDTLTPYLNKTVKFQILPKEWQRLLTSKAILLQQNHKEVLSQINTLKLSRTRTLGPSQNAYDSYKMNYQLPMQIKTLEDSLRKLSYEIKKLQTANFSPKDLFELALSMETSSAPLGLHFEETSEWLKEQFAIYPSWFIDGEWKKASNEPWLIVDKSFLHSKTLEALNDKRQPAAVNKYVQQMKRALASEETSTGLDWLSSTSFVMHGSAETSLLPTQGALGLTLPGDLTLLGTLDLACLQAKAD